MESVKVDSRKLSVLLIAAVAVAVAVAATALTDENDPKSSPVSDDYKGTGVLAYNGYSIEIPVALLRGSSDSMGDVDVEVSVDSVDVDVGGSSILFRSSVNEFSTTATFSDGNKAQILVSADGDEARIRGTSADGTSVDSKLDVRMTCEIQGNSDWTQWLGGTGTPGISDSVAPTTASDMVEIWRTDSADVGGMTWRTPGTAICVGSLTYYYDGSSQTIRCVVTSTGVQKASVSCPSESVYNMALAYGDGKVFVPTKVQSSTVVRAYDAGSLKQLFVTEPVEGGEVQGAITYHDGGIYLGTYDGDFVCFDTTDFNTATSDETVSPRWVVEASGWYNSVPAFFDDYCVIVEKGYDIGGAIAYSVELRTGAILDKLSFEMEYCVSGAASWNGRVYIPLNTVIDKENAKGDSSDGKRLTIRSYSMSDGKFVESSERSWASSVDNGGTQSIPVIWNGRIYIGGGGGTMGTSEPFNVLNLAEDGSMSFAYSVSDLQTKGTASLTTAYATSANGDKVYIYMIEYGHVYSDESATSTKGYSLIYCLSDSKGQTSAKVEFTFRPSVDQFAYQSFSISSDGYLLIRNDSTLFCYGNATRGYTASDLVAAIDRIIQDSKDGNVDPYDVARAEYRYASLSSDAKRQVTNYSELQALYRTVTFSLNGEEVDVRVLIGSTVVVPPTNVGDGKSISGWYTDGKEWNVDTSRVTGDMKLIASVVNGYAVVFDSAGGSSVSTIYVAPGIPMGYVAEPERDGYTFGGWYLGVTRYVPQETYVTSDITLTAKWLKNCTIYFDTAGGSEASSMSVVNGKAIGTLPTTKKSGYTFAGWFLDGTRFASGDIYAYDHDVTLVAQWTENSAVTIDNGNGVKVTGTFSSETKLSFRAMPKITTASRTALLNAAGSDAECYNISITGEGLSSETVFTFELPLGDSWDGRTVVIYAYTDGKVVQTSGTVSGGALTIGLEGTETSIGVEMTIAIAPGSDLAKHTGGMT